MFERFNSLATRFLPPGTHSGTRSSLIRLSALLAGLALTQIFDFSAALSAPSGSSVVGSGLTSKIGRHDQVVYTLVNYDAQATSFHYGLQSVPPGLVVDGDGSGVVEVGAFGSNTVALSFSVATGASLGFNEITINWSNVNTNEKDQATAVVLIKPYDAFSPTLYSTPNPVRLTGSASGNVTTLAGCLTDSLGVARGWNITGDCPFAYSTEIVNPKDGSAGLAAVTPSTSGIDIPAGAPTMILQSVTLPGGQDPVVLNLVSVRLDVRTSAGLWVTSAFSRYAVISIQQTHIAEPAEPVTWSHLKEQFGPR